MDTAVARPKNRVPKIQELELKDVVRNTLEEARMVLPGIQALFGFQLMSVFNEAFDKISPIDKTCHMAALLLTIIAIGCLMAPASYHRQTEKRTVSEEFVDYASKLLCLGMAPLMLSISLDTYIVCNVISKSEPIALSAGICSFLFLLSLWYLQPMSRRTPGAESCFPSIER